MAAIDKRTLPESEGKSADSVIRSLRPGWWAWGIASFYAVLATLWIYFSDRALAAVIDDADLLMVVSVYKGIGFVVVTSLLLLLLMRWAFGRMAMSFEELGEHEKEIERLGRLNASLSQINQAIVRTTDRDELFRGICDVLVKEGGFAMAWIGWNDPATARIVPLAVAGDPDGAIEKADIYSDDRPAGQGPSGMAFRSGESFVCNDLLRESIDVQWSHEIHRRGFRSMAALPIRYGGVVAGVLSVYSSEPHFFKRKEVALVEEAAIDVSHALDSIESERQRRVAEDRAHNEKIFSDTIIESMPGVVYFYDSQGRFLRWNRNFEVLSGYTSAEIAGMHPLQFIADPDRDRVEERIGEVLAQGESSVEAGFVSRSGEVTPFYFTGRRVQYEGRSCLVGIGLDISERERAEQQLRDLNAGLEKRVAERTGELERARVRAEAADRLKSAFLATMSHELRTPLNSIIGFTGIVLQKLAGPLNSEQEKQLQMVRSSARHLLDLINDVLDISKIEAGQMEVRNEPFDPAGSLEQALEGIRPAANNKGLELTIELADGLPPVHGDRRRFEQVVINLLNNAVKFTDSGRVSLAAAVVDGVALPGRAGLCRALEVTISDTGIGISQDNIEVLFQPFCQLDSGLSRQHEGTGLGLAICKRLCDLMGGVITVRSELAKGSHFSFILPVDSVE